jgi:ABC-type glycerol-3-phosphate transport system permease component
VLTALTLGPILAWTLFPIYWITTASFKTELSLYARPP